MASYLAFVLFAVTILATLSTARVIPAEPVSVMLDAYGNPVVFLREKRAPITRPIIPQRAMMFTAGYYRPARRSYDADQQQAAGVFAQGNAVSGGSYLGGGVPHLRKGPEPIEEPEISSAQAEAAPGEAEEPHEIYSQEDQHEVQEQNHGSGNFPEEHHETPISDPEPLPYDVESPVGGGGVETEGPTASGKPVHPVKKGKKTPVVFDEEEDDDEDDFEEEEPYVPYLPGKGDKRRQGARVPNLRNYFPMVFSFPGFSSRRGSSSSGSPPGVVTAIANSYSTGKGGVASSVATAYGGSPSGKKARRAPVPQE